MFVTEIYTFHLTNSGYSLLINLSWGVDVGGRGKRMEGALLKFPYYNSSTMCCVYPTTTGNKDVPAYNFRYSSKH